MINIEYEECLDWEHCEGIHEARERLSKITMILNRVIKIHADCEKELFLMMAENADVIPEKMSQKNKLLKLVSIYKENQNVRNLYLDYMDSDRIKKQLLLKQQAILEDIMCLKKIVDITPK